MRFAIGWRAPRVCRQIVSSGRKDTPARAASPRAAPGGRLERPSQWRTSVIDLYALIDANLEAIVIAQVVAVLVLLFLFVLLARRAGRLASRLDAITRGSNERSLEAILEAHLTRVHQVVRDLDEVEARTALLERDLKRTFARVGLVRYNPFEDTGGNQSFALALLDAHGDGFVVSSLHTRNQTRVYAKGVKAGRSDAAVSDEEAEALRIALAPPPVAAPSA